MSTINKLSPANLLKGGSVNITISVAQYTLIKSSNKKYSWYFFNFYPCYFPHVLTTEILMVGIQWTLRWDWLDSDMCVTSIMSVWVLGILVLENEAHIVDAVVARRVVLVFLSFLLACKATQWPMLQSYRRQRKFWGCRTLRNWKVSRLTNVGNSFRWSFGPPWLFQGSLVHTNYRVIALLL